MRSGNVRFHESLTPLLVPITELTPHPENPNNGDVDAIVESILVNGYYPAPIVGDSRNGEIAIGNHRYMALMELNSELAPVLWLDSDDEIEIMRIMLVDNRSSDLRKYDMGQVEKILTILDKADALRGSGYNSDYLEKLRESDKRAQEAIERANSKNEPEYVEGKGIMFLEVTEEDRARFYELTTAMDDSARFTEILDLAEEFKQGYVKRFDKEDR